MHLQIHDIMSILKKRVEQLDLSQTNIANDILYIQNLLDELKKQVQDPPYPKYGSYSN